MSHAYICDAIRTPVGRYRGALSSIRTDDLAAIPLRALMERNRQVDWEEVDDVVIGCANQAGEDNRNVARMASLLAGFPVGVAGVTVNRLCGSGLEAVAQAGRAIAAGAGDLYIAGGVESMSRAPYVMAKAEAPLSRSQALEDTTIGWRMVNPRLAASHGVDPLGITAENVARERSVSREDQDAFAVRSQARALGAIARGRFDSEIAPVPRARETGDEPLCEDEHPRPGVTVEKLAELKPAFLPNGTVTAGNSSGINDGAAALIVASERAIAKYDLVPKARLLGCGVAGVDPRTMGMGPVPATRKLLTRLGLKIADIDTIELNEAFAAQALAVMRDLGLPDDASHVNPNGGAIALGHPLGMSGARLAMTAAEELRLTDGRIALCTMCIGVGQGISLAMQRA